MSKIEDASRQNYLIHNFIKSNSVTGSKLNMFQYNVSRKGYSTDKHENCKFEMFKKLRNLGYDVLTEVEFLKGKGRADLVAFGNGKTFIIEIVSSEKKESIDKKLKKYPQGFDEIIIQDANKELDLSVL